MIRIEVLGGKYDGLFVDLPEDDPPVRFAVTPGLPPEGFNGQFHYRPVPDEGRKGLVVYKRAFRRVDGTFVYRVEN
jgi:hypothetical protein